MLPHLLVIGEYGHYMCESNIIVRISNTSNGYIMQYILDMDMIFLDCCSVVVEWGDKDRIR